MQRFAPRISARAPADSLFAELVLTPGPQVIATTGDATYETLYGRNWAIVWDAGSNHLQAWYEAATGAWYRELLALPPVFDTPMPAGRRLAATFDQAARLIVAYEDGAGLVRVTRWDPVLQQYLQNVTFAGRDPQLFMDATLTRQVPDSDVLLFYLSSNREKLMARVQRDNYGTEYELWDFAAPVILDRVLAAGPRYVALVSDEYGEPLPDLPVSALYPLSLGVGVRLSAELTRGRYQPVAYPYPAQIGVQLTAELVKGSLSEPVKRYEPTVGVQLTAEVVAGALVDVVTKYEPTVGVQLTAALAGGALDDIGVRYEPLVGVQLAAEITGGSYEPG